jgi:hypothetical protein
MTEIQLVARQSKNGSIEDTKVQWAIDNNKGANSTSITLTLDQEFFNAKNRIALTATDKIVLGSDSTVSLFLERLELSPMKLIDSVLTNIQKIGTTFDSLAISILKMADTNLDEITLLGEPKYVSRGLSDMFEEPSGNGATEFDRILRKLYDLDRLINSIEDFDKLMEAVTDVFSFTENQNLFYSGVINSIEKMSPTDSGINLINGYVNQIVDLTYQNLNTIIDQK